jgi:excisionase family DNA binding protein
MDNKPTFDQLPAAVFLLLEKVSSFELQLKNFVGHQADPDTWFNIEQLCQYHPDKPAKPTVYAYVQNRTIPFHKKGKKLFFLKSEIDAWLKTGRRTTTTEISSVADMYFNSKNR